MASAEQLLMPLDPDEVEGMIKSRKRTPEELGLQGADDAKEPGAKFLSYLRSNHAQDLSSEEGGKRNEEGSENEDKEEQEQANNDEDAFAIGTMFGGGILATSDHAREVSSEEGGKRSEEESEDGEEEEQQEAYDDRDAFERGMKFGGGSLTMIRKGGNRGICKVNGCITNANKWGLCVKHGGKTNCSHEGCTSVARKGGLCPAHGAEGWSCAYIGCTKQATRSGGMCVRHGGRVCAKICSHEGCNNLVQRGTLCRRHGAQGWTCSHEGCNKQAMRSGGMCQEHNTGGGRTIKICCVEGCSYQVRRAGVCAAHGAKRAVFRCTVEGCANRRVQGGLCRAHGANAPTCKAEGCARRPQKRGMCYAHGGFDFCRMAGCPNHAVYSKDGLCKSCFKSRTVSNPIKGKFKPLKRGGGNAAGAKFRPLKRGRSNATMEFRPLK